MYLWLGAEIRKLYFPRTHFICLDRQLILHIIPGLTLSKLSGYDLVYVGVPKGCPVLLWPISALPQGNVNLKAWNQLAGMGSKIMWWLLVVCIKGEQRLPSLRWCIYYVGRQFSMIHRNVVTVQWNQLKPSIEWPQVKECDKLKGTHWWTSDLQIYFLKKTWLS